MHDSKSIVIVCKLSNSQITVHNNLSPHICGDDWSSQNVAKLICDLQRVNCVHLYSSMHKTGL